MSKYSKQLGKRGFGVSLGGRRETSPARRKKDREARKREEAEWAAKCGPAIIKHT